MLYLANVEKLMQMDEEHTVVHTENMNVYVRGEWRILGGLVLWMNY